MNRTIDEAKAFVENRYRDSYRVNGYGLYAVELKENNAPIGICGFVKRDCLPNADIGFAFLPAFERKGYAFESADAVIEYGRDVLKFGRVLAVTTQDNSSSQKLLGKIGFEFERLIVAPGDSEKLKLFLADFERK